MRACSTSWRGCDDHAGRPGRADRRAHQASSDRGHRVERDETAVFAADLMPTTRPCRRGVDHGLRPLSDGDARVQAQRSSGKPSTGVSDILRARSGRGGGLHPRSQRPASTSSGWSKDFILFAPSHSPFTSAFSSHQSALRMSITIGIIGGSGLYDMAELTDREERRVHDAVRRAVGSLRGRHASRQARGVSRAARRRAPAPAVGAELPRQHLRVQDARRGAHPLGQRRRQPEGRVQAARLVIPDQFFDRTRGRDQHVLRPRARGARRVRASVLRAT